MRIRRVPNVSADTLNDFVLETVARATEVHSDAGKGCNDVGTYRCRGLGDADSPVLVDGSSAGVSIPCQSHPLARPQRDAWESRQSFDTGDQR